MIASKNHFTFRFVQLILGNLFASSVLVLNTSKQNLLYFFGNLEYGLNQRLFFYDIDHGLETRKSINDWKRIIS